MSIHPTAIIDPKADIDSSVIVGPYCVIDGHVRIGANVRLYQNVFVTGWTQIGESCVLHPGVIVGHAPQDVKYEGARSYCRIGPRTILREYVTVHRGTIPESETVVGADCFLLGGAHIAHNCRVGDRVTMINNALLAGHVEVQDRAVLGGGAAVHQFARVGELAMVGGHARVPMDVIPFAMLDPTGRVAGINRVGMRRAGITREEFEDVRNAYRILFDGQLPFSKAVEELPQRVHTAAGRKIVQFLQTQNRRGFAGRTRRGGDAGTGIASDGAAT